MSRHSRQAEGLPPELRVPVASVGIGLVLWTVGLTWWARRGFC